MLEGVRRQLSYANVMATVAVFVALGGASYAAVSLPRNSVGTTQLKKNAVTGVKIKAGTVTGSDVKDRSLSAKDFGGTLPAGPAGPPGSPGPQGAQGTQGAPGATGAPGPTASAAATTTAFNVIPNAGTEDVLALSTPGTGNTGPITVGFAARLFLTAAVSAFKTTSDGPLYGRLKCRLTVTPQGAAFFQGVGVAGEETFEPNTDSRAVVRSLALGGTLDVAPGTYDAAVRGEALAPAGVTAPISMESVSLHAVAIAR